MQPNPGGVSVTDMRSTRQSLEKKKKKNGQEDSNPACLFYCGTVHCAKQHLQSLVGYEDLKSLPIKTSLETLFSPQPVVKNKYRGDLSGSEAAFL